MSEESRIQQDRMRFTKNTLSSRLAILAIILNVLFFVSIYKVNDSAYYTWWMGISIVYNLLFMLLAFLSSEGVKNYNSRFSILLIILAVGQVVRIFIYPAKMFSTPMDNSIELGAIIQKKTIVNGIEEVTTMENRVMQMSQRARVIVYLALSAICLLAGAVINLVKSRTLAAHIANLNLEKA